MTSIVKTFAGSPVDAFVIRAAAKAFRATIQSDGEVNVNRIFSHGNHVTYLGV